MTNQLDTTDDELRPDLEQCIPIETLLKTKIRNTLYNNDIGFSMAKTGDRTARQMIEELASELTSISLTLIKKHELDVKVILLEELIDIPGQTVSAWADPAHQMIIDELEKLRWSGQSFSGSASPMNPEAEAALIRASNSWWNVK